jgi:hypothetical protein
LWQYAACQVKKINVKNIFNCCQFVFLVEKNIKLHRDLYDMTLST